ncbi:hypothetical protein MRS45_02410 [Pseudomonas viridiflava]|jgi:hypothetical protein|uniref:hypothetical protein n=1 Tax=Pseudomonas TaxID=286 RepID=UPI001F56EB2F|nr:MULTISPECIES: hypothetical protein [Pseudomonas]MCJ8174943.1 hypothetical protein [Pseudomonas viridiflava]
MTKPTFPQRAEALRQIASDLSQNNLTVAQARVAVHRILEGSGINSPTAANIALPEYLAVSEHDLSLLARLADAVAQHDGGGFESAFEQLSLLRAMSDI